MKKLTILVDMDDVLENLVECWVNELNKKVRLVPAGRRYYRLENCKILPATH